jgi:hypothetical protein
MRSKTYLLLFLGLTLATRPLAADTLADIEAIPASNPYRAALVRYAGLSAEDRETLDHWISPADDKTPPPTLTAAQQTLVHDLTSAVVATANSPATTAADWAPKPDPKDPDDPTKATFPSIVPIRTLARIAAKTAESLPPADAIAAYAAVAQLGRQQRAGTTLLQQLVGVAVEGIALSGASKDLLRFSPAELQHLSAAWDGLLPYPTIEAALAGERDLFFKPIIEKKILPGLRALLAEEAADAPDSAAPAAQPDAERTFTRDLRLSGLLDLGDGERRILLENAATHVVLTLRENVAVEGITLTGIDFEKRRAYIRHDDQEAVIYLQSKQIVERSRAAAEIRALFESSLGMNTTEGPDGAKMLRALLDRVRAHPDGADGYVRDLLVAYQQSIDRQIADAAQAKALPDAATPPSDDPLLNLLVPTFGRAARTLHNIETESVMLKTAVQLRLAALGQPKTATTLPADPWAGDGSGFSMEKTPDGGFLLRSRYEFRPDKPLTYKFAAPDAGFVR